ncbi:MAG: flavodoxin family protein [Acidimicrobiales bacterium]
MNAIVIFESLTGNTRHAAELITEELIRSGVPTVISPIDKIDLQALSEADLVVVGGWVDGLFFFGQRPGRAGKLVSMPVIDGKLAAVFCTYAVNAGSTLEQMSGIVSRRGGEVIGGMTIRRNKMADGAIEFVGRLLGAIDQRQASSSA